MNTILTTSTSEAARFIKKGGIVAFPTETVYGLGADVFDESAVAKIFEAKRRPNDNPLIAHVGNLQQIELLAGEITPHARKFIEAFFPAPLTLVLPKSAKVPLIATANLETIGVRMPQNKIALEFLEKCETPVVAPSANLSGRPSPTTWRAVYEDLNSRIDCILQGETTEIGLESTVIDCTSEVPLILRTGAITLENLREIIPETAFYKLGENESPKSPGTKYKHYSPRARVVLFNGQRITDNGQRTTDNGQRTAFIGIDEPQNDFDLVKICRSVEDYGRSVFEFFRECDSKKIDVIYCEIVKEKGIGLALMDRLKRAAED